jgi:hypothetical protein
MKFPALDMVTGDFLSVTKAVTQNKLFWVFRMSNPQVCQYNYDEKYAHYVISMTTSSLSILGTINWL